MEHSDTDNDEVLVSSSRIVHKKKTRDDLIIKELDSLPFADDIKKEAFEVYKKMRSAIKRKNNRKYLKFFCIYNAGINLDKIKDAIQLAKIFEIEPNELNKIFKTFSYENTGYKMKPIEISPLKYINDYYKLTDLRMDEIYGVINFSQDILNKDELNLLAEEFPQVVAAGLIIYYMHKIHGIIPPQKFIDHVGRSDNMINKMVDKIGSIYNS